MSFKIKVQSAFKGSNCGASKKVWTEAEKLEFRKVFPTMFQYAIQEKKLSSKITKIKF
jgi:hypothetical protein